MKNFILLNRSNNILITPWGINPVKCLSFRVNKGLEPFKGVQNSFFLEISKKKTKLKKFKKTKFFKKIEN